MHITHQSAEVPLANIQVPKAYGYVMLVGVSSLFLAFQLGGRVYVYLYTYLSLYLLIALFVCLCHYVLIN